MPIRKISFASGEFYHIYNRGNSKQQIFRSPENYQRFIDLLYLSNGSAAWEVRTIEQDKVFDFNRGEPLVAIGSYCLMPNHFHILLTPLTDDGVRSFMLKLSTGYSMYFNKKYNRTGSLFEGRFKSEYVDNDRYLKYLFSYIHLNPVKLFQNNWREVGLIDINAARLYLDNYQYSSYLDTKSERPASVIMNLGPYPDYFSRPADINREMLEWLSYPAPTHHTEARPPYR